MFTYNYRALNERGRSVRGVLSASSEIELHHLLRDLGLEMVDCAREDGSRSSKFAKFFGKKVQASELIVICRHLETMLRAGVPLLDTLGDIRDSASNPILRDVMAEVRKSVSEGGDLSSAFAKHPEVFSEVFVALIAAGESTGKLDEALKKLIDFISWSDDMARRAKKAVRYPAFMAFVMVGVTMFMMLFVVPQVIEFLRSTGNELPFVTVSLIETSNFFANYWWIIMGAPMLAFVCVRTGMKLSERFALAVDRVVLQTPVIGDVVRKLTLARFAHMMAIMYRTGIPILRAIENCRRLVTNRGLGEAIDDLSTRLSNGESLSAAMHGAGEFPRGVVRLIAVGEAAGNLDEMLEVVAHDFDRDADEAIQNFIGMIEPALTLIMGGLMAWIALGVFGPIYDNLSEMDF